MIFAIFCLMAAASLQTVFAQVLIAPETDMNSTVVSNNIRPSASNPNILNSVRVLVDNNLEVHGAQFPFIYLPDQRLAFGGAASCGKLGERLYSAQSSSLPSVQKMLTRVAPSVTEFWIDTGAGDSRYLTACDTLVLKDGQAAIKTGGSCMRLLSSLCSNTNTSGKITVQAALGRITGARDAKGFRFQGIRYALPPTDNLRFAAPVPVTTRWSNAVDATAPGNKCPQLGEFPGGNEDCLFLNVFTPALSADKKNLLPVMFWFHGGAFVFGSGSDPTFNGANMASRGQVVIVTLNFRLGLLGFFERVDAGISRSTLPGNQGLRDILVALKWVQDNIASFGGDKTKVTIFGTSSGATTVRTLLSMPTITKDLFHAAISLSDVIHLPFNSVKAASTTISGGAMELLKCSDLACMRSKSVDEILNAQQIITGGAIEHSPEQSYIELIKPSIDGILLFNNFDQLLAGKGDFNRVPFMIGTMGGEAFEFLPIMGQVDIMPEAIFGATLMTLLGYRRTMITVGGKAYPFDLSNLDHTREATGLFATDYIFVCPAQFISKAYAATNTPIYHFQFQRGYSPNRPASDLCVTRPCHSDSLAIIFASPPLMGNATSSPWTAADAALSRTVIDRWTAFAISGNPNIPGDSSSPVWPQYDGTTQSVFMIDTTSSVSTGGIHPSGCGFLDQYIGYDFQL
ncbi:hypothetical protein BGZ80_006206 [Entomortierella chlamydospora]|uniref:Carboxylic ester hydrolase n=1 Tax=Entomortierella chlamydospora TaxID=101097 RepID=A0A9P6STP4_9FUNG|nr:hypothetical protein BGZ79_004169 [Entomortierella chlamydospora]KAG0001290.1 hypothetical protein BGZ80_006206 [Entomortierella chlamydospora]